MEHSEPSRIKTRITCDFEHLLDIEQTSSSCFEYLASLMHNSRVRNEFFSFAEKAKENKNELSRWLSELGSSEAAVQSKCQFCKVRPESFSISGALDLGIQLAGAAVKHYEKLFKISDAFRESDFWNRALEEKEEELDFLRAEKNFNTNKEVSSDFISKNCIVNIISKLYK
jgi:rubrerythrin